MKSFRSIALMLMVGLFVILAGNVTATRAYAQADNARTITGSPLTIEVGANGSVQVFHELYSHGATYGTADSGFFLATGGTIYGPDLPGTNSSSASISTERLTLISHDGPSGSGARSDPLRIVTQQSLDAGSTNLLVTQTISYVNGDNYFQLDWQISNQGSSEICFKAYHAADIYFADSDYGYGYFSGSTGSVGGFNEAQDWFMVFAPVTPADRYEEADYGQIWNVIGAGGDFSNSIDNDYIDNGIGLQWNKCLAGGGSQTITDLWSFGASEATVIPTVIASPPAGSGAVDVWAKDSPEDDGTLPSSARNAAWWTSPDIIVRNKLDSGRDHQNPIRNQTNYVYVQVRNQGSSDAAQVRATVYWANPALGLFWPNSWNELNSVLIDVPADSAEWTAAIPWEPPGTGHFCLLVRLESVDDPITAEGDVSGDNNIAQRNLHIIDLAQPDGSVRIGPGVDGRARIEAMAVGPPGIEGQMTPIDVVVQYPGLPAGVTMSAELPEDIYERWMANGGNLTGATLRAGRIYIDGDVETVIQGIPLAPFEEAPVTFELDGPTVDPFAFGVIERVDGQDVGGSVYVYEGLVDEVGLAGFQFPAADLNIIFLLCCLCLFVLGLVLALFLLLTRGRG